MSNVVPLTFKTVPSHVMTESERASVMSVFHSKGDEELFPLSRLYHRFALTLRDYPLENPSIQELDKVGVVLKADYPNFELSWLMRVEQRKTALKMPAIPDEQLYELMRKCVGQLGLIPYSVRFAYRIIHELGEIAVCESVHVVEDTMMIDGYLQASHLGSATERLYHPFKMVVRKKN